MSVESGPQGPGRHVGVMETVHCASPLHQRNDLHVVGSATPFGGRPSALVVPPEGLVGTDFTTTKSQQSIVAL